MQENYGSWFVIFFAAFVGWLVATAFLELYSTVVDTIALVRVTTRECTCPRGFLFCVEFAAYRSGSIVVKIIAFVLPRILPSACSDVIDLVFVLLLMSLLVSS